MERQHLPLVCQRLVVPRPRRIELGGRILDLDDAAVSKAVAGVGHCAMPWWCSPDEDLKIMVGSLRVHRGHVDAATAAFIEVLGVTSLLPSLESNGFKKVF